MCGIAGFLNPRNNDKKTEMMKGYFWKMAVH